MSEAMQCCPLVRTRPADLRGADPPALPLPPVQSRLQAGLALLRLVLRRGLRGRCGAAVLGPALRGALREQAVRQEGPHALHALLPVVSDARDEALDLRGRAAVP